MGVDITVGERIPEKVPPLFRCLVGEGKFKCPGPTCHECAHEVREEERTDSPHHSVATAQGMRTGGYNFDRLSYGYYDRWLKETHIEQQFPMLNYRDQPSVIAIPDGLGVALHKLATDIELGIVPTKYPKDDAAFTCWFAWWCIYATKTYGPLAAILFH
jgi:hypothetical protein